MAKQSTLDDEELASAFTRGLYKAQNWVYESSAEEVAKAIAPYFEDTNLALIEKVVERYREQKSYATDPIIDENEFDNLLKVMKEANVLETEPKYTDLVNRSFADEVVE